MQSCNKYTVAAAATHSKFLECIRSAPKDLYLLQYVKIAICNVWMMICIAFVCLRCDASARVVRWKCETTENKLAQT